jgi:hypothetical protein
LICHQCGKGHRIDEMELTFRRPDDAANLTPEERERTVQENKDLCIIEGKRFFIRGVFPLPVEGRERAYDIGLWVEVEQSTFERVYELWDESEQEAQAPFDGWLANSIPTLPETTGLPAKLHLTGPTSRPAIFISSDSHPLYSEQSRGITAHRAHEYNSLFT